MAESHLLFVEHPDGHAVQLPCVHLVPQHPNGDSVTVPCTHGLRNQHARGDRVPGPLGPVTVPCIHLVPVHPNGDNVSIPCIHPVPEHPEGHLGPVAPCPHLLPVVRSEYNNLLRFYTDDIVIQDAVMDAIARLNTYGVSLISPLRPLHIFHRPPADDGGGDDRFWSHYSPVFHSIQVMDVGQDADRKREVLRHEIGHALLGNSVTNHYAGGPHTLTGEADTYALAMSEAWAHFVALVLTYQPGDQSITYRSMDWENMSVSPNGKVEYCAGCFLWDLFDLVVQSRSPLSRLPDRGDLFDLPGNVLTRPVEDDLAEIAFSEMFRVYSPTLQTIPNGPVVSSVWDFADRLKKNNQDDPVLVAAIDQAVLSNVGQRPS